MIICEKCEKILDNVDPSRIQKKTCIDCVQKEGAHMVIDFEKEVKKEEPEYVQAMVENTVEYAKCEDKLLLIITSKLTADQKKDDYIQIGLTKEQLEIFVKEMSEGE